MISRKILLIVFVLFLAIEMQGWSQSFWSRTFSEVNSESGSSIQKTADGGYVVAGYSSSYNSGGWREAWILKLDSSGNIQWQKAYGDGTADKEATSIELTADGGYIVAGYCDSCNSGATDFWVFKLDSSGNKLWEKTYGGSGDDYARSVHTTSDNGYIVGGYTNSFGAGEVDAWILKLDFNGEVQWQKTYGATFGDVIWCLQTTSDGGFIASGSSDSLSGNQAWIVKLDSSGNIQWQKTYGGTSSYNVWFIQETSDGGYITAGDTSPSNFDGLDIWVLKLDSAGNIQWQKTYGGSLADRALAIQPVADGGYIVGGFTYSFGAGDADVWILKLNSSGDTQWQKSFGGNSEDLVRSVQTLAGGFLFAGHTLTLGNVSNALWILSLDANGEIDPSCTLGADTSAVAQEGTASANDISVSIADSNATLSSSNVNVIDTTAQIAEQCPAPSYLFYDEFDDGTPPTDWTYVKPSWTESNGSLIGTPQGRKAEAIASPAFVGCSTCTVGTSMMSAGGINNKLWLLAWYLDKSNTIELLMKEESDKWVLKQRVGGSVVAKGKGTDGTIDPNLFYTVQLSFDGANITLTVNGQQLIKMPLAIVPNGTVGFRTKNTIGTFDFISVD
jgi:hypothetical protein